MTDTSSAPEGSPYPSAFLATTVMLLVPSVSPARVARKRPPDPGITDVGSTVTLCPPGVAATVKSMTPSGPANGPPSSHPDRSPTVPNIFSTEDGGRIRRARLRWQGNHADEQEQ